MEPSYNFNDLYDFVGSLKILPNGGRKWEGDPLLSFIYWKCFQLLFFSLSITRLSFFFSSDFHYMAPNWLDLSTYGELEEAAYRQTIDKMQQKIKKSWIEERSSSPLYIRFFSFTTRTCCSGRDYTRIRGRDSGPGSDEPPHSNNNNNNNNSFWRKKKQFLGYLFLSPFFFDYKCPRV